MTPALAPTAVPRPVDTGASPTSRDGSARSDGTTGSDQGDRFRRELDRAAGGAARRPASRRDGRDNTVDDRPQDPAHGRASRRSSSTRSSKPDPEATRSSSPSTDDTRAVAEHAAAMAEPPLGALVDPSTPPMASGSTVAGEQPLEDLSGVQAARAAGAGDAVSAPGVATTPAASTAGQLAVTAVHGTAVGSPTTTSSAADVETAEGAAPHGMVAAETSESPADATLRPDAGRGAGATTADHPAPASSEAPTQPGPTTADAEATRQADSAVERTVADPTVDPTSARDSSSAATTQADELDEPGPPRTADPARPTDIAGDPTIARHDLSPAARQDGAARLDPNPTARTSDPVPTTTEQMLRADELAESLRATFRGRPGTKQLTIQLHPAELGAVQIQARVIDGVTHLVLRADSPAATDRLAVALDELRTDLANHGVDVGDLDLRRGPSDHQGRSAHDASHRDDTGGARAPLTPGRGTVAAAPADHPQRSIRHDVGSLALDL